MTANSYALFQYLEKESIKVDKKEFLFQVQSHPDYPSLLSISDALSFFKINNLATVIDNEDLELLPNNFIALIKDNEPNPFLAFVVRTNKGFQYTNDVKSVSVDKETFTNIFENIVLVAEKEENQEVGAKVHKSSFFVLLTLMMIYLASIFITGFSLLPFLFVCFASVGIYLSIEAISHEFGIKTKFSAAVCAITAKTDCNAVINSKKPKLFQRNSLSDYSITFFTAQLLALLFLTISNQTAHFFYLTSILLLPIIPVTLLSIFQQGIVLKKWCPICLGIIAILYAEALCLIIFDSYGVEISAIALIYFAVALIGAYCGTTFIKELIRGNNELRATVLKSNRFKRNYSLFKLALDASPKTSEKSITSESIVLGDLEAKVRITVVYSPFCGHCKAMHKTIREILALYEGKVCFILHFNCHPEESDEEYIKLHHRLLEVYFSRGQDAFLEQFHNWFETKEQSELTTIVVPRANALKFNSMLFNQFNWNQQNKITFTPALIINDSLFPKEYDRDDLVHFINDLEEGENF